MKDFAIGDFVRHRYLHTSGIVEWLVPHGGEAAGRLLVDGCFWRASSCLRLHRPPSIGPWLREAQKQCEELLADLAAGWTEGFDAGFVDDDTVQEAPAAPEAPGGSGLACAGLPSAGLAVSGGGSCAVGSGSRAPA